ncbi:hypothetical protein K438DRAFT_1952683 [Mycena galopus ATCC 62051]|nr:hypothetical protein K438DRAFT_1952683 [Mycena galopus ATCC 62051]
MSSFSENAQQNKSAPWLGDGNSTVFRGMQDLSQPPDNAECLIIQIEDDPADVANLVKVLYTPTLLAQRPLSLAMIRSLLRVCSKYDFGEIYTYAVKCLTDECPATLHEYDSTLLKRRTFEGYPGIELDIINILRENNITSALPCAFYRVVSAQPVDFLVPFPGLDAMDSGRCVRGQTFLLFRQFEDGFTFGWIYNFLNDTGYNFCDTCYCRIEKYMIAGRVKMWQDLPAIFDLY